MAANGDGPRNHPLLKDLHLPPLGIPNRPAPLVTKTLLSSVKAATPFSARQEPLGMGQEIPRLRQGDRRSDSGNGIAVRHDRRTDDLHGQGQTIHPCPGRCERPRRRIRCSGDRLYGSRRHASVLSRRAMTLVSPMAVMMPAVTPRPCRRRRQARRRRCRRGKASTLRSKRHAARSLCVRPLLVSRARSGRRVVGR